MFTARKCDSTKHFLTYGSIHNAKVETPQRLAELFSQYGDPALVILGPKVQPIFLPKRPARREYPNAIS